MIKGYFFSAYASLKSINDNHSHHLLIYSNNKDNSLKVVQFIKLLIEDKYFDIPDLFYSHYHGDTKQKERNQILRNYNKSQYGIISCVYCLGEGYDNCIIDSEVFSENMSSYIRIAQSALRGCRKNQKEPNKITKIILPILYDWFEDNPDLKKVREIIYQMGLEDETITQKIKVYRIDIEKHKPRSNEKHCINLKEELGEYDEELTQKLRLKTVKRSSFGLSYEKARKILYDKKIRNKENYFQLCEMDNRLPKEPEIVFKHQITNWIDYMSIERKYYDLETCKRKVLEYLVLHSEVKINRNLSTVVSLLCKMDNNFPPNDLWVDYYKDDNVKKLPDIISIPNTKKKISIIKQ